MKKALRVSAYLQIVLALDIFHRLNSQGSLVLDLLSLIDMLS